MKDKESCNHINCLCCVAIAYQMVYQLPEAVTYIWATWPTKMLRLAPIMDSGIALRPWVALSTSRLNNQAHDDSAMLVMKGTETIGFWTATVSPVGWIATDFGGLELSWTQRCSPLQPMIPHDPGPDQQPPTGTLGVPFRTGSLEFVEPGPTLEAPPTHTHSEVPSSPTLDSPSRRRTHPDSPWTLPPGLCTGEYFWRSLVSFHACTRYLNFQISMAQETRVAPKANAKTPNLRQLGLEVVELTRETGRTRPWWSCACGSPRRACGASARARRYPRTWPARQENKSRDGSTARLRTVPSGVWGGVVTPVTPSKQDAISYSATTRVLLSETCFMTQHLRMATLPFRSWVNCMICRCMCKGAGQ